jgi:hypothetical protein
LAVGECVRITVGPSGLMQRLLEALDALDIGVAETEQ